MAQSVVDERQLVSTEAVIRKGNGTEGTVFVSTRFCQSDADVSIVSCDDVVFKLHKKNLAISTGGFPPLEFTRASDVHEQANLSEKGHTLDLLFQFVYPQRYPEVLSLKIKAVSDLADAAEKYEVYGAISVCNVVMRSRISNHPLEVFVYATRYNYLDVADQAALLILGTPLSILADKLTADALAAWARYIASWDAVRTKWTGQLVKAMIRSRAPIRPPKGLIDLLLPECLATCTALVNLLSELSSSMITKNRLSQLISAVECSYCKRAYPTKLGDEAAKSYAEFPKFRTFWRHQSNA